LGELFLLKANEQTTLVLAFEKSGISGMKLTFSILSALLVASWIALPGWNAVVPTGNQRSPADYRVGVPYDWTHRHIFFSSSADPSGTANGARAIGLEPPLLDSADETDVASSCGGESQRGSNESVAGFQTIEEETQKGLAPNLFRPEE
jgi:hypothetical protein